MEAITLARGAPPGGQPAATPARHGVRSVGVCACVGVHTPVRMCVRLCGCVHMCALPTLALETEGQRPPPGRDSSASASVSPSHTLAPSGSRELFIFWENMTEPLPPGSSVLIHCCGANREGPSALAGQSPRGQAHPSPLHSLQRLTQEMAGAVNLICVLSEITI